MPEDTDVQDTPAETAADKGASVKLDLKVPVVTLVAWGISLIGFAFWAGAQNTRFESTRTEVVTLESKVMTLEKTAGDLALVNYRLTKLEESGKRVEDNLDVIKQKLR